MILDPYRKPDAKPDIRRGRRRYRDCLDYYAPKHQACEHCDGERSTYVREDALRGLVCPECDSSLDEMFR